VELKFTVSMELQDMISLVEQVLTEFMLILDMVAGQLMELV
jgi:hypothetical protein